MVLADRTVGSLRDPTQYPRIIYRWWQRLCHRRGSIRSYAEGSVCGDCPRRWKYCSAHDHRMYARQIRAYANLTFQPDTISVSLGSLR